MQKPICNVVVLAAGAGSRFSAHGITLPKPLIHFRGKSLLDHTLDVARELVAEGGGRIIVVAKRPVSLVAWGGFSTGPAELAERNRVVEVSVLQRGPVMSAVLALAHLPLDEQVVFLDCDNFYPPDARKWTTALPAGNFIVVADRPSHLPATNFCTVVDYDGRAIDIQEKTPRPTLPVGTGAYGFADASLFAEAAFSFLYEAQKEVPMSSLLGGLTSLTKVVRAEAWHPLGTPEQLEAADRYAPTQSE